MVGRTFFTHSPLSIVGENRAKTSRSASPLIQVSLAKDPWRVTLAGIWELARIPSTLPRITCDNRTIFSRSRSLGTIFSATRCKIFSGDDGKLDRKSTRLNSSHLGISYAV